MLFLFLNLLKLINKCYYILKFIDDTLYYTIQLFLKYIIDYYTINYIILINDDSYFIISNVNLIKFHYVLIHILYIYNL